MHMAAVAIVPVERSRPSGFNRTGFFGENDVASFGSSLRFEIMSSPATSSAPKTGVLPGVLILAALLIVMFAPTLWPHGSGSLAARAAWESQERIALSGVVLAGVLAWCGVQLSQNLRSLGLVLEQGAATQAASERAAYFSAQAGETQRYASAMALLGHESLEVRLGGIYALERLARESSADHGPITEVLGAFVRGRAPWKEGEASPARPGADVQAVLSVLGRRTVSFDPSQGHIDLHGTGLSRAYLPFANLAGAFLYEANLEDAVLQNADLRGAWAWRARLNGAVLEGARLEGADLTGASGLTPAQLKTAHLDQTTKLPEYLRADFDWSAPAANPAPPASAPRPVQPDASSPEDLKLPSLRASSPR